MPGSKKDVTTDVVTGNPRKEEHVRTFAEGSRRSYAVLSSVAIGFGTYHPGWRWSLHAGAQTGKKSQNHIGYVLAGRMMVKDASGKEVEVGPGRAFEVGPDHDAWVVGNTPCTALDFVPIARPTEK